MILVDATLLLYATASDFEQQRARAWPAPHARRLAIALEHGLTLCSSDGDFARFSALRWENPLGSERA